MHQVHLTGSIKIRFLLALVFSLVFTEGFSQAVPTPTGSRAYAIFHETDGQNQIQITFNGPVTMTLATGWTVTFNGLGNFVSTSSSVGSTAFINLSQAIGIGQTVEVSWIGGGGADPIVNQPSVNKRALICSDFNFAALIGNTPPCAPVSPVNKMAFSVKLAARNSDKWNLSDLTVKADWMAPAATPTNQLVLAETDAAGNASVHSGNSSLFYVTADATGIFTYPNDVTCGYTSLWRLQVQGVGVCPTFSPNQGVIYASWNTEGGPGDGILVIDPTVINADQVCIGSNANVTFQDLTDLNCVDDASAPSPLPKNSEERWVRVSYGVPYGGAANTIPNVFVGGVPVTDAGGNLLFAGGYIPLVANALGTPDAFGVVNFPASIIANASNNLEIITTSSPAGQAVGQQFFVTMEYWNTCAPYTTGDFSNASVLDTRFVEIITSPAPPGFAPTVFCENQANNTYAITATGTGIGTYKWYSDPTLLTLVKTGSTFNPVTEGGISKTPGAPTVTNFYLTETLVSGCVSLPATVPFTIHKEVNPGTIQYSGTPICFNNDPPVINSMTLATGGDGLTYTYQWQRSTDGFGTITIIGGATGTTYDPPVLTQTTSFRRIATSGVCTPMPSPAVTITVNPLPTGVVSGGGNACSGTDAPDIIFTFTGASPFNFEYAFGGVPQGIINNVTSPYILTPAIGTYTLVSLIDNNSCVATTLMGIASSVVSGSSPPILEGFTSSSPVCDDGGSTNAPDATLDLAGGIDNYDITFSINGNFYTQNLTSDLNGLIPLNPSYTIDWGGLPGSYALDIITIKNTMTLCAGNTPFAGPSLVVNSRPATPTGPINSIACSNPGFGAPLNVTDPDPTNVSGVDITWSTGGPALTSYSAVGTGVISGLNNKTFTPATSATSTFFAFAINSVSGCISNTGIAVSQQQDLAPSGVTAGLDQLNICTDNPSATMAASAPGVGETGTWTVPGEIVYFQNFSGFANGTTTSGAVNGWTRDVSDPQSFTTGVGYYSVQSNRFEGHDTNGSLTGGVGNRAEVIWTTPVINISGLTSVQTTIDLINSGTNTLDGGTDQDYIQVYYKLDNGVETNFNTNGFIAGNGSSGFSLPGATATATAFATPVTGSTLQIFVKMSVNANNEKIAFDNVTIKKSSSTIVITNPDSNTTTVSNLPAPAPGNLPITTQFKWSVTSPLGVCAPTTSVVNLRVNPLPTSNIVAPVLCDASPGNPLEVPLVDLTTYNALVTDATIVDWFSNSTRTIPVLSPLTVSNGNIFYWRATSAAGCQNIGSIMFTVRALPSAIDQTIEICEDAVGSGSATGIDLTSYEATITNGESPRTLEWYEDDGSGGLGGPIPGGSLTSYSIASAVSVTRLLHLKVIDSSSPTVTPCFEIADVTLEYKIRPTDNLILDGLGNVVGPTFTICTSNSLVLLQVDPNQNPGSDYVWNIPPTFGEFEIVANDNTFFVILRFPTAIPGTPPSANYPSGLPITVTEMYGSCTGNTIGTTVIVESIPLTPVVSGPPRVCVDGSATFTASPATTATYTWSFPAGVTILSADPTQSSINVKWGSTAGDVFVSYETPTGCVSASSIAYPVIAIDRPNILSSNAISICNGQNVGAQYFLQSDISNTTYNWIVTGVTGSISGAAIGNQNNNVSSINQTLTNTLSGPATVTYAITPIGPAPDFCAGPVHVLTVSLNVPVVNSGLDAEICSRDASGIVLSTDGISVGAGSYKLLAITVVPSTAFETSVTITSSSPVVIAGKLVPGSSNAIVGASGGIDFIKNDKFINTTSLPIIIRYEIIGISPAPASCPGPSEIIELTINPEPILDPLLSPTPICSGDKIDPSGSAFQLRSEPIVSVTSASFIIRSISFPGLTAGASNTGIGGGKNLNAMDNDTYINITPGALTATYTIAPVSTASCIGPDQTVLITVNPAPSMKSGLDRIVCNEAVSNIVLQDNFPTTIAAVSYDIISVTIPVGLTPDGGNASVGLTTNVNRIKNDKFVNNTTDRIIVTYQVVPVSVAGCRGPQAAIMLTVEPQIISATVNTTTNICSGSPVNLTFASPTYANGNATNPIVTLSYTMVAVTGISGNTLGNNLAEGTVITDVLVNTTNASITVNYKVTPRASSASNGVGCTGTIEDVFVIVQPRPKITTINNKTICENEPVNLSLVSTTTPSTGLIKFFVTAVPSSGNVIGFSNNSFASNNTVLADVLVNNGSVTETVTYTIEPRNVDGANVTICAGPSIDVIVTVSPRPIITSIADFAICSGERFNPIPIVTDTETAIPESTLVTWTVTQDATVTGESNGVGNSFSQVLFNNSSDKRTVVYTINAKNITNSPSCSGTPIILNVTVYPVPKIVSLPSSVNVCDNGTLTPNPYILTSSVVASLNPVFDWTIDDGTNTDLADLPPVTNGTAINQTYVNTGTFLGTYQYTITPHLTIPVAANPLVANTCTGQEGIMVVNVAPPVAGEIYGFDITGNKATNLFLCKGSKEFVYIDPIGLPLMEVVYKEGSVTKTLTKLGGLNILQVSPTVTTVYQLISVKDKFGCVKNINQSVTVNVDAVSNEFSIVGPTISCSPFQVQFKHDQIAGVNYTWKWLDGPDSTTYQATSTVMGKIIKHTFLNPSPSTQAKFKVSLEAFLDTTKYQLGCKKTPFVKEIKVYPTITTGVFPDNTVLCSGETVKFTNTSQGVSASGHRWFYRVLGSTQEIDIRTTSNVSYKMVNESSSNPIIYEVVYKATNGNCPAADVVTPITVYRGAIAKFDEGIVPPHIGGHSIVKFTNTTAPVDASDFKYEWEFGADGVPASANGVGPFIVDYLTPGDKDVILTVTNTDAEAAGRACVYEFKKAINVLLLPLVANFTATPLAACFPSDITVTENTATGDLMEWRVVDSNGRVAATSNANLPVFQISNPGKYSIFLKTSSSFTGQEAKTQQDNFEIYPVPVASFDARPTLLYVPDTELVTYNFTTGATDYLWDFGDNGTSTEEEPTYLYKIEGAYDLTLIAMNDHGDGVVCSDTLTRKITAKQGGVTKVPNAFTPNPNGPNGGVSGNGSFNDVFLPYVKGVEEFNMQIYDRWGNLIFESNNSTIGWDGYDRNGRLMQSGVFVYKLTLRLSDGQRTTQIGDITMIR